MRKIGIWMMVAFAFAAHGAQAQSKGFDPRNGCGSILRGATEMDKMMVAAWVFGFLASQQQDVRPVDRENNRTILNNLFEVCAKDQSKTLLSLVQVSRSGGAQDAGSENNARAFLQQFLEPGADLVKLTAALAPTAQDIHAVYSDPLASKLVDMYAGMFVAGAKIGPKPDQDSILVVRATTGGLQRGDAVLRDFPGGYKRILASFKGDFPIVRFKFVRQGESLGMAFDGLIHVNGRWVLMPKPWRALE